MGLNISGRLLRDEFPDRIRQAYSLLSPCRLCPRRCGADRLRGQTGVCGASLLPKVASCNLHFGEEPPISGTRGSGTVFFSGCNLNCVFCQNFPISQLGVGRTMTCAELARKMIALERRGAHNINFVTPAPHVPQVIESVFLAREGGLTIPIVYNTNGYELPETIALLDGVVDIYLPDLKYTDARAAGEYSGREDYPAVALSAIEAMAGQIGEWNADDEGIGKRGLIIRHMILPGDSAQTQKVLRIIRKRWGKTAFLSLMNQYFPAYKAKDHPDIRRPVNEAESTQALKTAQRLGLDRGWRQMNA